MDNSVFCPDCKGILSYSGKKWNYSVFNVEMFYCKSCNQSVNAYFKDKKLSHMIPFHSSSLKANITTYLKNHESATLEELASSSNYDINRILNILLKMEQTGKVERILYKPKL